MDYYMNQRHKSIERNIQIQSFKSKIVQAKWIESTKNILKWDQKEDGVQWFMNTSDNTIWLETDNPKYLQWEGKKKSWLEWNELNPNKTVDINNILTEGMRYLMSENITWGNPAMLNKKSTFHMEQEKPYRQWLEGKDIMPDKMNCWESVLYAAYITGLVNKEYIKKAIRFQKGHTTHNFIEKVIFTREGKYKKGENLPQNIPYGYVVIFGEKGEHVALSKGESLEDSAVVYELDFGTGGIVESTLVNITERNNSYSKKIAWGPFPVNPTLQDGESISDFSDELSF